MGRLDDTPHIRKRAIVDDNPVIMAGFLPNRSDARPHATAKTDWLREKTALVKPAHQAMSSSATPKLPIISGRYGKTEVIARGSANLATALKDS